MDLTLTDHELIVQQCILQNAITPIEVSHFTEAYREAKTIAFKTQSWNLDTEYFVRYLAFLTDPTIRAYAHVPRLFANGNKGIDPALIPQAMKQWCQAFAEQLLSPDELYIEFEKIHPFVDGNGRVGHLLWSIANVRDNGRWPTTLPPDMFGE